MILIDSVARFIPQVLGAQESATEESIYSGLLECDQYTKPQVYEEMAVPEVLYSGNHKLIHLAQYRNALELTQARRPDLFRRYIEKVEKGEDTDEGRTKNTGRNRAQNHRQLVVTHEILW